MATSVLWRGLPLGAGDGEKTVSIEGWESLPSPRYEKIDRARGHGSHPSEVFADERTVTVTGTSHSVADRDRRLAQLQRLLSFGVEDPLAITVAGRTLSASAQLLRCDPVIAVGSWNVGLIKWVAQWRCPDPLRYGPQQALDTGLPVAGGGLQWPLFSGGVMDWGSPSKSGQLTLTNPGTADAAIEFEVKAGTAAGLPQGWEVSAGAQRLTYPTPVPPGQSLLIDTDEGSVLAEGTADRRAELTRADWLRVPAAAADGTPGSLIVQFTSLGGAYDPGTRLHARWRETTW